MLDRIILFYMDTLIRPGVHEENSNERGEGKTEHKSRSQVLVNIPGRFMINNEDRKQETGEVLSQIRFTLRSGIFNLTACCEK